jgi:hypothetical protein
MRGSLQAADNSRSATTGIPPPRRTRQGALSARCDAVDLVVAERVRVWRLYMLGSALSFGFGYLNIDQTLAVRPDADSCSGVPLTRGDWYAPPSESAQRVSRLCHQQSEPAADRDIRTAAVE